MKRTTRLIALLCALVLLAALAGCGKNPTPTPDPTPTPEYEMIAVTMPEQQADQTARIVSQRWFCQPGYPSPLGIAVPAWLYPAVHLLMTEATTATMFWKWAVHISPIQYRK